MKDICKISFDDKGIRIELNGSSANLPFDAEHFEIMLMGYMRDIRLTVKSLKNQKNPKGEG